MTKLNQIVAVEKTVKETTNKETAPLFHNAKKADLFAGLERTYEPVEDGGEQLPPESAKLQVTAEGVLEAFSKPMTRLFDVIATKETANTGAFGDVVVNGVTLVEQAPVSFLLQLEKQLTSEVRGLIVSLPTLDPAQDWQPSDQPNTHQTDTIRRHRTKKIQRAVVLYQATVEHPAQTAMINEDVLAGYWNEKKFSGALTAARKQELLERVDELIKAVKFAREQANDRTVTDVEVGETLFSYLLS